MVALLVVVSGSAAPGARLMTLACESSACHAVPVYHSYQTHCSQPESVAVLTSESVLEQQALVLKFAGISE